MPLRMLKWAENCKRHFSREGKEGYSTAQKKVDSPSSLDPQASRLDTRSSIVSSIESRVSRIESRVSSIELRVEKVNELVA